MKWVDTINPERKDAIKYYDALVKEGKKASSIRNILAALKGSTSSMGNLCLNFTPLVVDPRLPLSFIKNHDFCGIRNK